MSELILLSDVRKPYEILVDRLCKSLPIVFSCIFDRLRVLACIFNRRVVVVAEVVRVLLYLL